MKGVVVFPESYPTIFKAFQLIDYDNGMVNRLEPERTSYLVPLKHAKKLYDAETGLRSRHVLYRRA